MNESGNFVKLKVFQSPPFEIEKTFNEWSSNHPGLEILWTSHGTNSNSLFIFYKENVSQIPKNQS